MRDGLHPPTETLPDDEVARLRSYFDDQGRIDLVVWVMHEQKSVDGPVYDHHLMLGMDDADYESGETDAVLRGVEGEVQLPGWADLFPLSEVEALREFGTVVWARDGGSVEGLDPLDFRYTFDPVDVPSEALEAFRAMIVNGAPAVVRVEATRQRLWKGERERWVTTTLFIGWDEGRGPVHNALSLVESAARDVGLDVQGLSAGIPSHPAVRTAILFDARAEAAA